MSSQVFQGMFKSLKGHKVIVELKNEVVLKGILQHSDNYFNLKLMEVEVLDSESFPQLPRLSSAFVRGSAVKYVHLPPEDVKLDKIRALCRLPKPN
jgi:U6 snRNA-associated Sm-like protein LSm2